MGKTRDELISDIELRVTRGKPSDDLNLDRELISHWLDIVRDDIIYADLTRALKESGTIDSGYVKKVDCVKPVIEDSDCNIDCGVRYCFELPEEVMELRDINGRDKGLFRISTNTGTILTQASEDEVDVLKDLWFSKPSPSNITYYREGKKVFFDGINETLINRMFFNLFYIPSSFAGDDQEGTDEFNLDGNFTGMLLEEVEAIARRFFGGFEDYANDGYDGSEQPPVQ